MLSRVTEQLEKLALRTNPRTAISVFGKLPRPLTIGLQEMRFRDTLKIAAAAPFYSEEFRKRGIDVRKVRKPAELGDFYTTGDDLLRHGPEAFLTRHADTAFETTGTTSAAPKRVFFSNRELNAMGRASALGLYQLGLRREDVVLSAFDVSFWVSPAVVRTALQYLGCFHVEAGKIPPLEFYERAKRYRPTVIFGEPSWIVRLSEIADAEGTWPLKFLFGGGENLAEETRREIERIWGASYYVSYGQTESFGVIGVECSEKNGYHRNDLNFLFEVADAGPNGQGELVYTTLTRNVMPLIRYRSTDITRLIDEPCQCGLFARRIAKIAGRCDEMVVCGMGNISPWVFTEILRDIPGVTDEWQVRVWHQDLRDIVELRIEVNENNNGHSGQIVVDRVRENLRERFPDFSNNLEIGLYDLRVNIVPRLSLRTSRKLRRVITLEAPPDPAGEFSASDASRLAKSMI
jgi:phenylacetate-CoA ligase